MVSNCNRRAQWHPFVGNSKGIGSRERSRKSLFPISGMPTIVHENDFHVNGSIGEVQFISANDRADLMKLTKQVAANNHWNTPELGPRPNMAPVPVPARVGEPSVCKHIVYIIKENHTYDFDFGDIPRGNGEKNLCAFGEGFTPNEHALAEPIEPIHNGGACRLGIPKALRFLPVAMFSSRDRR